VTDALEQQRQDPPTGDDSHRARFRINSGRAISETIDGEVIVIDVGTGSYFSLRGTGAEIWDALTRDSQVERIVDELAARYDAAREEIAASVISLLEELEREELVIGADDGSRQIGDGSHEPAPTHATERSPYQRPVLEKHTDMQDLILLDPVHDISAAGWPHKAPPDGDER
jgi:Coenzyme PQQ synthesis protein D (PqqD)